MVDTSLKGAMALREKIFLPEWLGQKLGKQEILLWWSKSDLSMVPVSRSSIHKWLVLEVSSPG
jgi:hypothetical protein